MKILKLHLNDGAVFVNLLISSNVCPLFLSRYLSTSFGFATKKNKTEISKKTGKNLINVFVPTTPNPTSGFLLMFPEDEVIYMDMTFEEASKFIVSAGTSNPSN